MRLASLLLILAASSCASSVGPRSIPERPSCGEVIAISGHGRVLSQDFSQLPAAVNAALVIDRYYALAAQRLGHTRDEDVEIWLVPAWPVLASTFENCIVFDPSPEAMPHADWILTHEFVHWHASGTVVQRNLPPTIVEGLCDRIAADLTQSLREHLRDTQSRLLAEARERGELSHVISHLDLDSRDLAWLSHSETHDMHALAIALVDRIGVDALLEAAEQGPVSSETILDMADVSADGEGL
jgi:hypothetical protein